VPYLLSLPFILLYQSNKLLLALITPVNLTLRKEEHKTYIYATSQHGNSGLLPALRPIERSVDLRQYAGKTVAIDGHCILHRGAFGAATELALNQPTDS